MAKKKPPIPYMTKRPSTLTGVVFKAGLTVVIAIVMLSLLVWIGKRAGSSVAEQGRFDVPISGIVVTPPPGVEKDAFLSEVRALANLPEAVSAVNDETPPKLAAAFALHPWVNQVQRVSVNSDRTIHVELSFRVPVLAVPMLGTPNIRLVDKSAVLLPPTTVPETIAVLRLDHPRPASTAGQVVPDDVVKRAAELVEIYKASRPRIVEKTKTGWKLTPMTGPPLLVSW